ncbi:hypothetical protein [Microvirga tunisiensis]|uniref:BA14K family protein n=1 Tax=Microvirga tunisiensis TaxID=2108360 RepID=A0A5N7MTY7_9HYPH|nr:hypothetical protein [Microvirga tunisiensis]MPR09297.1 hypothetical protein [Microvirga tunisiensis]MPR27506.1 hypothetical protein [Microvirga tunisiensis]
MRLRHLLAALVVTVASGSAVEASPKAVTIDLDKVQTSYARETIRGYVRRAPTFRRTYYRNLSYRRPVRVARYAYPYRYGYYRPRRAAYYGYPGWRRAYYPYRYYGRPYGYYRPARYYGGYGCCNPYYGYGRPYGGVAVSVGF